MQGHRLCCPNCEMPRNILSYKHFERVAKYEDQLNVVLKCPGCSHIFSPGLSEVEIADYMRGVAAIV